MCISLDCYAERLGTGPESVNKRYRAARLSHLEHVHGKTIGVNLAIHVGPKAMHLIALDISNGH
jgi:hypothetical protein